MIALSDHEFDGLSGVQHPVELGLLGVGLREVGGDVQADTGAPIVLPMFCNMRGNSANWASCVAKCQVRASPATHESVNKTCAEQL